VNNPRARRKAGLQSLTPTSPSAILICSIKINGGSYIMPEPITTILEAMKASHQNHLDRLLAWKAEGGTLPSYPNSETIDDLINRERLAINRCTMSIEHIHEHETV